MQLLLKELYLNYQLAYYWFNEDQQYFIIYWSSMNCPVQPCFRLQFTHVLLNIKTILHHCFCFLTNQKLEQYTQFNSFVGFSLKFAFDSYCIFSSQSSIHLFQGRRSYFDSLWFTGSFKDWYCSYLKLWNNLNRNLHDLNSYLFFCCYSNKLEANMIIDLSHL